MKKSLLNLFLIFSMIQSYGQVNKVLMIGIDGCRPDGFKVANTPNMDALLANSTYTYDAMNEGVTSSGPGWSTLLTSVWPDKHGVVNNSFSGSDYATYPHLFQRIEEHDPALHTVSICQWHPVNNFIAAGAADVTINVADHSTYVEQEAVNYLTNNEPDALFLHFDDVDHAGHGSGFSVGNPNYIAAIETVDLSIGGVMAALNSRPNIANENWAIIISTDHGGIGNGHGGNSFDERNIFMIVSGDSIPDQQLFADSTLTTISPVANCLNDSVELYFDGTSQVSTPLHSSLDFGDSQDFTIECKVRTPYSGDIAMITDKDWDSGYNKGWVFSFNYNGGPWKVNVGDGSDRIDLEGNDISDNEWHMLSATFDRDGLCSIYEDGVFVASTSMAAIDDIYTGFPLLMGQDPENDYAFSGSIAEVRVFHGVLAPSSINSWHCQILNNTHPAFNDLVGHWRAVDGGGSTVILDSGPNALHGSLTNTEWRSATDTAFVWVKDYSTAPSQVDFGVTALEHLCVPIDPLWDLDGTPLGTSCSELKATASVRVFLEGPFDPNTSLMKDNLRTQALIPDTEPFTALGFTHVGVSSGTVLDPDLLLTAGNDAIIDWVFLELRDALDNSSVLATQVGMVQSDGDVISASGEPQVQFDAAPGSYYLAVKHRNHLGAMTASTIDLSSPGAIDFTLPSTTTYGTEAQFNNAGTTMLWAGNVVKDSDVKYTGLDNDRDPILVVIGGVVPTATLQGYLEEDVNMDGLAKYVGIANDRDLILVNIGGIVPTATRTEQIP